MINQFSRTELVLGEEAVNKLKNSKVVVFGIGGVGSYVVEALARSGIGNFILVDADEVSLTNINRQLIATHKTIGMKKVEVARRRIFEINPDAKVEMIQEFFTPESKDIFDSSVSYVVDCIDTVASKIDIVMRANRLKVPVISCMGTGNKLDPTKFEVTDINKTSVCPLAKVMRKELRARGIKKLKVVYSKEEPIKVDTSYEEESNGLVKKKYIPGSVSFVPSVAGLIIAGEVIKDIIKK